MQVWNVMVLVLLGVAETQYVQAEDRGNKLKQLLVKAKKDLSDAKKLVCNQHYSVIYSGVVSECFVITDEQKDVQSD